MMSDIVELQSPDGDQATIQLHGATVTSWKCKGQEMLFVSEKAVFDKKKAIRGGIPVVFPNFGPWSHGPQHGFARTSQWEISQHPKEENGETSTVFSLEDSESTRKVWNYRFRVLYEVTVGKQHLKTTITVENKDEKAFEFTTLLHTYLRVPDVTQTAVSGLKGLNYVDKVLGGKTFTESNDPVKINGFTDRVYQNSPSEHKIMNVGSKNCHITLWKENFPDTVSQYAVC
ncbi:glucose-6-phosphate 1-epimerase-like isoform X2 [Stylophora pistillata]|uniref:glucose-6-phosphate 1-epimerase-like isoform X2 n=1 Tax=Stylophora pistillata TaxID=50429 RepID=UPI000C040D41|nr:glucose-6-phosphate 1-epimerase-like isoform X2 [Stylophora pistillata]